MATSFQSRKIQSYSAMNSYAERMLLQATALFPVPNGLDAGMAAHAGPMAVGQRATCSRRE
jgi:hypothetical protein